MPFLLNLLNKLGKVTHFWSFYPGRVFYSAVKYSPLGTCQWGRSYRMLSGTNFQKHHLGTCQWGRSSRMLSGTNWAEYDNLSSLHLYHHLLSP